MMFPQKAGKNNSVPRSAVTSVSRLLDDCFQAVQKHLSAWAFVSGHEFQSTCGSGAEELSGLRAVIF